MLLYYVNDNQLKVSQVMPGWNEASVDTFDKDINKVHLDHRENVSTLLDPNSKNYGKIYCTGGKFGRGKFKERKDCDINNILYSSN